MHEKRRNKVAETEKWGQASVMSLGFQVDN